MKNILLTNLLLLILVSGCRKEKFGSESNWLTPVLSTELTLGDIIPDSVSQTNSDSAINLVYEEEYGVTSLKDILQIPDRVENMEVTLSSLVLEDRSFTDTLTLQEIYPASIALHGQTTLLPAQDFPTDEGTKIDVSEEFFSSATFVEGFIDITIANDLPVEAEIMEFQLVNDDAERAVIVSGVFTDLGPGEEQSKSYSLAGLTVNGKLELRVTRVKTKASNGLVEVDVFKGLRTTFGVRGLKPSVATAVFPAQNLVEREDEIEYEFGGARLTQVQIKSGSILMKPTYNHIYNELVARIEYSGVERTLSLDDKIEIEFGLVDLVPELVIGDPGYHELTLKDTLQVGLFNNIDGSLSLEDATMNIDFYNSFGIEAEITADNIVGKNTRKSKDVKLIATDLSTPIFLGKSINGSSYTVYEESVTLDKSNSNLKQFLENMPDKIFPDLFVKIRHRGTVNQGDFAFDFSELKANLKIEVPLIIGMDSLTISSTEEIDLFANEEIEKIKGSKIYVNVENDFPISGIMELEFLDASGSLISKAFNGANNIMMAAEVDENTGKTALPAESTLEITFTKTEMAALQNATEVRIIAQFDTKDAQRYQMYSDYGINVNISTQITYENKL